jgi:Cytochrome bd terminal oxidase subunit II
MGFYWAAVLAISTLLFVLLDGLDLCLGIISGGAGCDARRDAMMNAIAPIWDGNETWQRNRARNACTTAAPRDCRFRLPAGLRVAPGSRDGWRPPAPKPRALAPRGR